MFSFAAAGEQVRLNNMAVEIGQWADEKKPVCFSNPRDGWVFIAVTADAKQDDRLTLVAGDVKNICAIPLNAAETEYMRRLEQGAYTLTSSRPDLALDALTIRAIPEMHFCRFPVSPKIPEFGVFDWEFLKKYVLPHINTIVGNPTPEISQYVTEWTNSGRKWIGYYGLPHHEDLTGPKACDYWTSHVGFQDSRLSGLIADEFSGRQNQWYPAWIDGMKLLGASRERENRAFYGYCGGPAMYTRPLAREMVRTIFENDFYTAYERYTTPKNPP